VVHPCALPNAGNTVQYSITVINTGDITLKDLELSDPLITSPLTCNIRLAGTGGSSSATPSIASFGRSDVLTCTGSYTVTAGDVNDQSITNRATATATKLTQANAWAEASSSLLAMQVVTTMDVPTYTGPGELHRQINSDCKCTEVAWTH
jgi:hypothetical protein